MKELREHDDRLLLASMHDDDGQKDTLGGHSLERLKEREVD
jgi:hypothetical protein